MQNTNYTDDVMKSYEKLKGKAAKKYHRFWCLLGEHEYVGTCTCRFCGKHRKLLGKHDYEKRQLSSKEDLLKPIRCKKCGKECNHRLPGGKSAVANCKCAICGNEIHLFEPALNNKDILICACCGKKL